MKSDWTITKLGDLYDVRDGTHDSPKYHATGFPLITSKNLKKEGLSFESVNLISKNDYAKINQRSAVHKGDVLFAMIGTIGNPTLVTIEPNFAIKNVALFKIPSGQCGKFLKYFLESESVIFKMTMEARGTTQKFVGLGYLRDFPIKVPPLPEQRRIVDVLDAAFADIATARANAEKNLQNARALFESHLQSVFTQRGEGWVETTLGDTYDVRDGTHDSPKYHATGYPLITSKNLKREGLSFDDVKLICEHDYININKRSEVHEGDVLFAMIGTIGNPTIVEVVPHFAIKNVALFKIQKDQSGLFLKYYLDSAWVISKMMKEAKGTTQKFVGLGYLRGFPINLPPLAIQKYIVDKLNELSVESKHLESIYQRKITALDELKKSLLHQAFNGQL